MKQKNPIISFIKEASKEIADEIKAECADFQKSSDEIEQNADVPVPTIGIVSLTLVMSLLLIFTICAF